MLFVRTFFIITIFTKRALVPGIVDLLCPDKPETLVSTLVWMTISIKDTRRQCEEHLTFLCISLARVVGHWSCNNCRQIHSLTGLVEFECNQQTQAQPMIWQSWISNCSHYKADGANHIARIGKNVGSSERSEKTPELENIL